MKIGMIGSIGHNGYVFEGVGAREGVVIGGVAPGPHEADAERLARQAERVGTRPRVYGDYRSMLDGERPDIVTVACHFHDHAGVCMEVLRRGHHVFVEKPLATTLEDFAALEAVHGETEGVALACMLGLRYEPGMVTAWRAVSHGAVGVVRMVHGQKSYKLGERAAHYRDRETFGGTIPWVGSHAIDWVRWFSGERFEGVYAGHSRMGNRGHGDLEATAVCHFTMSNDVLGSVSLDYLRPAAAPTHGDDRVRVTGTGGVMEVRDGRAHLLDGDGERELRLEPKGTIFGDFIDQARGEGMCLVSAEDSFAVTRACLLARRSADEGRLVAF